jgi:hypothetical protein
MRWYCFEDKLYVGDGRVEGSDDEGHVYVAIFSGPDAHERAQEYADWKTSTEQHRPIRKAS